MTWETFNKDYIAYGLMAIGNIGLIAMFLSGEHGIYINSALQMTAVCDMGAIIITILNRTKNHDASRNL